MRELLELVNSNGLGNFLSVGMALFMAWFVRDTMDKNNKREDRALDREKQLINLYTVALKELRDFLERHDHNTGIYYSSCQERHERMTAAINTVAERLKEANGRERRYDKHNDSGHKR